LQALKSVCRFDPTEPRHGDVEHNDIGIESLGLGDQLVSIRHPSDYRTFTGEYVSRQREHRRAVVGHYPRADVP
jgi:hypothetical protein